MGSSDMQRIRISTKKLEPGMKAYEDILDKNGVVLMPQDSAFTVNLIELINRYNISTVNVYRDPDFEMIEVPEPEEESKTDDALKKDIPMEIDDKVTSSIDTSKESFKAFQKGFEKQSKVVEECISSIFKSKEIKVDKLYGSIVDIFKNLKVKNDLLLYLNALDGLKNGIYEHSIRVSLLAHLFGNWLELPNDKIMDLTIAGMLHDIGMTQVPVSILEKKTLLTDEEFDVYKGHTTSGAMMVLNKNIKKDIRDAILSHHERVDGSGYPYGKTGDRIGLFPKIIAIVDIYDELLFSRKENAMKSPFDVIKYLEEEMITLLDTECLLVFSKKIPHTYKDAFVNLTNGEKAQIIFINQNFKTQPIIRLERTGDIIDLSTTPDLKIEFVL